MGIILVSLVVYDKWFEWAYSKYGKKSGLYNCSSISHWNYTQRALGRSIQYAEIKCCSKPLTFDIY